MIFFSLHLHGLGLVGACRYQISRAQIKPWGTPHPIIVNSDEKLPIDTKKSLFLSVTQTVKYQKVRPSSPVIYFVPWATTVQRSSNTSAVVLLKSAFILMSYEI